MHGFYQITFVKGGKGTIEVDTEKLTIEFLALAIKDDGKQICRQRKWKTRSKKKLFNILRHCIGDIPSYEYKKYLDFIDRLEEKDKLENKE